jgi:prepilin-type N-terminal cleavage/methylation domain-containing protein
MSRQKYRTGVTLFEVMVSMALLGTGALIGLTLIANTSARGEITRDQAIAYKSCQDMIELLLSMDKPTLLAQKAALEGAPGSFLVTALKQQDGSSPSGRYTLTDVSSLNLPGTAADTLLEIAVTFSWKQINVQLTARRYLP